MPCCLKSVLLLAPLLLFIIAGFLSLRPPTPPPPQHKLQSQGSSLFRCDFSNTPLTDTDVGKEVSGREVRLEGDGLEVKFVLKQQEINNCTCREIYGGFALL